MAIAKIDSRLAGCSVPAPVGAMVIPDQIIDDWQWGQSVDAATAFRGVRMPKPLA